MGDRLIGDCSSCQWTSRSASQWHRHRRDALCAREQTLHASVLANIKNGESTAAFVLLHTFSSNKRDIYNARYLLMMVDGRIFTAWLTTQRRG